MRQLLFTTCLVFVTFLTSGCDELQPPKPTTKTAKENRVPVRRFILTKFDAGVAFDTQTGQLCKTWEWQPLGKEPATDLSGNRPQRMVGEFTPSCLSVYKAYPSGTGTTSENLSDE
jgi:hypothetical protein